MSTAFYSECYKLNDERRIHSSSPWEDYSLFESEFERPMYNDSCGLIYLKEKPRTVQNWINESIRKVIFRKPVSRLLHLHEPSLLGKPDANLLILGSIETNDTMKATSAENCLGWHFVASFVDEMSEKSENEESSTPWALITPIEVKKVAKPLPLTGIVLLSDAECFMRQNNLDEHVDFAVRNIRTVFGSDLTITIDKTVDFDSDEEWISLNIPVTDHVDIILEKYDKLTQLWINLAPWPQRGKIRFSLNPV